MSSSFILLHVPNYVGDVYIRSIKFEGNKVKSVPQTAEERHVYAGFVRGLNGGEPTAISNVEAAPQVDTSKGIYRLSGQRMQATSLDVLPSGLYIVDGKKVVR